MIIVLRKKRIICFIASLTALVFWMIFIFMMSAQSGELSSSTSGGLIEALCKVFVPNFHEFTEIEQTELISKLSMPIRKAAHFSEYLVLSLLLNLVVLQSAKEIKLNFFSVIVSFVIGVIYSLTDEIHQYFVPGRVCAFTDVLIDSSGVLFGCLFFAVAYKLWQKNKAPTV